MINEAVTLTWPLIELLAWLLPLAFGIQTISSWYSAKPESERSWILNFLLVGKRATDEEKQAKKAQNASKGGLSASRKQQVISIAISFFGLQGSFLTWGWVQEKIMKTEYGQEKERFPSSSMLVLSNRVFAILFSMVVLLLQRATLKRQARAPFVAFAFPALANTISSFAGYESLKFMSFPMSTVCKTLKIVPTMTIGTLVHSKRYSIKEYVAAVMITLGAAIFAIEFSFHPDGLDALLSKQMDTTALIPGVLLMSTYLCVDAFTSNLQTLLFNEYLLTPYECMLGVNLFSILLNLFNLIQSNQLLPAMSFLWRHPQASMDVTVLALTSALGQLFIYYTIEKNGPVVFTIIQLIRQLLAILLSSWSFGHVVNHKAWFGLALTSAGMLAMNFARNASSSKTASERTKKDQ